MGSERLTIPPRPICDVSPAPFSINPETTLVRRGRKVYEQSRRPFSTLFSDRFGLMSKLKGGCVGIALMLIVWPIGLLWVALYLLEVVIVSIWCCWTMATSYRYACTYPEYLDWCRSVETRQAQIHQKRIEEVVRREREASKRRHAEQLEAERKEKECKAILADERTEMMDRVAACDLEEWRPDEQDPFVLRRPLDWKRLTLGIGAPKSPWWPLKIIGLAYTNVVTLPMNPARQRWNPRENRYETVGPNAPPMRSIALLSPVASASLCKPFEVDPDHLGSTVDNHLVLFVMGDDKVLFVSNPLRWETYVDEECDEETRLKIERVKPLLQALYKKVVSGEKQSDGWT